MPSNNPFAGAAIFLSTPFGLGAIFSNALSCFFLFCFSSDSLVFLVDAFSCARVPLRNLSISNTFIFIRVKVSALDLLPDEISDAETGATDGTRDA